MDNVETIMVALALEEGYSSGVFDCAAKMARMFDAKILAAHVINRRDVDAVARISSLGYEVDGDHYVENIRSDRKELLGRIIEKSGFPLERVKIVFRVGNPIDELLKLIEEKKADLVVMGPKGRTDLQHILIGSVAEKMFRKSPVTVISYRDRRR